MVPMQKGTINEGAHTHVRITGPEMGEQSADRIVDPQKYKEIEVEDGGRRHQLHNVEKA